MFPRKIKPLFPSLFLCACLVVLGPIASARAEEAPEVIRIALLYDGESSFNTFGELVQQEILALTEGEMNIQFRAEDQLVGNWTPEGVQAVIDSVLRDPEIDLVLALGAATSHAFCCEEDLPKPVIAAFIIDAEIQKLPRLDGRSGVENLNYLNFPDSVESDVALFREIVPFDRLTVVFSELFAQLTPDLYLSLVEEFVDLGLDVDVVLVGHSADEGLAAIPEDTQAVYLTPLGHLPNAERLRFYDELTTRGLPTFSIFGISEVREGVFASQRDEAFFLRLARRIALNVQRILLGEDAGTLPVDIPDRYKVAINMEVARRLGTLPPWDLMTEAELINEQPTFEETLTLRQVASEAVEKNLDIVAKAQEVAAGRQQIASARAQLRPTLSLSATGLVIDDDRAAASFGAQPERSVTAGLGLTQLLYAEPVSANVVVQEALQLSREQELEQLRLDITLEAAETYVNVLRAQSVESIRRNNLDLTRSNLQLARVRRAVGSGGPSEVFRWESEVAVARRDLLDARSVTYQTRVALNRLLNRPLEEGYTLSDLEIFDPQLLPSREPVLPYIETPLHFEVFREFNVEEGLSRAPELDGLDAAIAAQERVVTSARRAFWAPLVALRVDLEEVLERGGEGASSGGAIPGVTAADDTNWSVAVQGSLDLFDGGERRATQLEAEETLAQLKTQRRATAERIEQLIRSRLYDAITSYTGIRLTEEAAAAAERSLELVTDAYSRGALDILDLLDAQNAQLNADLQVVDARYQFFIDLTRVERAVNSFEFTRTPEEQIDWMERLKTYFDASGVIPRRR